MLEDTWLLWKFKRGSSESLERIYEKYETYLITVATALLNNTHAAEEARTWLPNLNLCLRRSGKSVLTGALLQYTRSNIDPKRVCEKLRRQAERGEIILDVNEPDQKNEPIVLVVTYPAESRSADWKKVLYIDQSTRLVKKEETFEMRGGRYRHERTAEFFDYNQPIDPERFNLSQELPENVIRIDLPSSL